MIQCRYCEKFNNNCPKKRKNGESKACSLLKRKLVLTKDEIHEFQLSQERIKSRTAELKLATYIYNQMILANPEIATIINDYNKAQGSYSSYQEYYMAWKKKTGKKLKIASLDKCLINDVTGKVTIGE